MNQITLRLMTVDSSRISHCQFDAYGKQYHQCDGYDKRRLEIKVGISYHSDLLKAKDILRRLVEEDPELLEREEIQIFVDQLADSAVILGIRAWVRTDEYWNTKWRMNERIKLEFDANGIQIPFPQMDVYLQQK